MQRLKYNGPGHESELSSPGLAFVEVRVKMHLGANSRRTKFSKQRLDMAKSRYASNQQYFQDPFEIERALVSRISDTGKEQLKRRRKAGLSSFYAREGKIIEVLPNNSEHAHQTIKSNWVVLKRGKRSLKLK
jgi:hypothetical protein